MQCTTTIQSYITNHNNNSIHTTITITITPLHIQRLLYTPPTPTQYIAPHIINKINIMYPYIQSITTKKGLVYDHYKIINKNINIVIVA